MVAKRMALITIALLAGCGGQPDGRAAADDSTRDLQRPEVDASSSMNDRPAPEKTPVKVASKPAVKAAPRERVLASGTAIAAKFDASISSRTHKVGQKITGTVSSDVKDKNGRVVIPAGSKVNVTIAAPSSAFQMRTWPSKLPEASRPVAG